VVSRTGVDDMERRKILPYRDSNYDHSTVQPVADTIPTALSLLAERILFCEMLRRKVSYKFISNLRRLI
jgi:hypothetical protein